MNPSLLKDFADFKKRSVSQPSIEAKKLKLKPKLTSKSSSNSLSHLPKQLLQKSKPKPTASTFHYKTPTFRSKHKFAVLATIVDHMKNRYLQSVFDPLTLDEILDQIKYTDISAKNKHWLGNEALKENSKLRYQDGKFVFNPKYQMKNKKELVRLLMRHEQEGKGGILLDEIRECLPGADDVIKSAGKRIMFVTRPDKKDVLFFKNEDYLLTVDEEFQKHWRAISVDGIGEADIDRYLVSAGITTMQDTGKRRQKAQQRKKAKRRKTFKKLNDHLGDSVLKDYSQDG